MLQNIRDGIAKILVYLLFGVLILSFALWGTTDFFGQGAVQNVIAEVGDSEITAKTIERQYRRQYRPCQTGFGGFGHPNTGLGRRPRKTYRLRFLDLLPTQ